MSRLFAVIVSLLVALPLVAPPADAFESIFPRHRKVDKRVARTALGTGAAATVGFWSMLDWGRNHSTADKWAAWGVTTAACAVLSPMVAAALVPERELTLREVYVLEGSCLIPIVGGLLVNAWLDANPQWNVDGAKVRKTAKR